MKKLTTKWKIFLTANYAQLIVSILSMVAIIITMRDPAKAAAMPNEIYYFITSFISVCINSLLNIYIINRYFPDNPLSHNALSFLKVMRIIMIILTGLLLILSIATLYYISSMTVEINWRYVTIVTVFNSLFLLCLYTTILQFQIGRYLRRKNAGKIDLLIESIGT
jgi:hypothetical protein